MAIGCAATVAGFAGRLGWPFDLFCHFRVQYLAFFALCAVAGAIGRKRGIAALAACFAVVNLVVVAPLFWGAGGGLPAAARLRILSANLNASNPHHERALRAIRAADADVLLLMEVTPGWEESLRALEQSYPHGAAVPRDDNFGIALLSRVPGTSIRFIYAADTGLPIVVADLELEGKPLRIIGAHPLPPMNRRAQAARDEELRYVARQAAGGGMPVAALGDFNTTPWSPSFGELLRLGGLRDGRKGHGLKATWPCFFPPLLIPIDHCVVSGQVGVSSFEVGPDIGSDHYPIIVELALKR